MIFIRLTYINAGDFIRHLRLTHLRGTEKSIVKRRTHITTERKIMKKNIENIENDDHKNFRKLL